MLLRNINESINYNGIKIGLTRSRKDFTKLKELDREVYGGRGYMPPVSEIVIVAQPEGNKKLAGYIVAKPYRKTAYCRRVGVSPEFEDMGLRPKLIEQMLQTCREMGFEFVTARSTSGKMDAINRETMGDPVKTTEYPKKTVNRYKKNLTDDIVIPPAQPDNRGINTKPVKRVGISKSGAGQYA